MKDDEAARLEYGFSAQDVQKIYPDLVVTDAKGTLSLNYLGLIAPMSEAIGELKEQNEKLSKESHEISEANEGLHRRLEAIERRLDAEE